MQKLFQIPTFLLVLIKKKALNHATQGFFCCLGRIRTLTGGTRIRRATITPQDILKTAAKVLLFSDSAKFSAVFFTKTAIFFSHGGFSEHFRA